MPPPERPAFATVVPEDEALADGRRRLGAYLQGYSRDS
jgi:hypothetical protein